MVFPACMRRVCVGDRAKCRWRTPRTCLMARRSRESTTREWPCTSRHAPGRMKRAPSSAMVARARTEVAAKDRPLCAAPGFLHRMTSHRQHGAPPELWPALSGRSLRTSALSAQHRASCTECEKHRNSSATSPQHSPLTCLRQLSQGGCRGACHAPCCKSYTAHAEICEVWTKPGAVTQPGDPYR